MNENDFLEYMQLLKPALEEYAKKNNMNLEELLLQNISLENTGLFNYKGGQSTVFNRFKDNNIKTLKELFNAHNYNSINYGKNSLGKNYYIHNEINGIIALLKYKYLGILPKSLDHLFEYKINTDHYIRINPYGDFGYPGKIFNNVYGNEFIKPEIFSIVDNFYKTLKSCGFDQSAIKVLIDIAYEENINNITLGEFLSSLSLEKINEKLKKVPQELKPLLNILNIILDYYNNYYKPKTETHTR